MKEKISKQIKGMDISTLVEEERCGAKYYDDGIQCELLDILQKYGVNSVRLRIWNDPYGAEAQDGGNVGILNSGRGPVGANGRYIYGAGTNDFETTAELAKRAKAHGMSYLLDFHYSDFWADPGKQYPPKAWSKMAERELIKSVHDYTYETLMRLKELDLLPYMVQVGNELTNGCCWPLGNRDYDSRIGMYRWQAAENGIDLSDKKAYAKDGATLRNGTGYESNGKCVPYFNPILKAMLVAGIRAVREVSQDIIVMLHLDNGGNNELYRSWFDGYFACDPQLAGIESEYGTDDDFDVIGLSYYPFWHGNFEALKKNLDDIAVKYGKELVIAEVSMGHSMEDYRRYERKRQTKDSVVNGSDKKAGEKMSTADETKEEELKGMATREELVRNLDYPMTPEGQADFMKHLNTIISQVPDGLGKGYYYWEPAWIPVPGCGWATPASLEYIHDKGPCGNEWANQALFDYDGNVLPAMKV